MQSSYVAEVIKRVIDSGLNPEKRGCYIFPHLYTDTELEGDTTPQVDSIHFTDAIHVCTSRQSHYIYVMWLQGESVDQIMAQYTKIISQSQGKCLDFVLVPQGLSHYSLVEKIGAIWKS